MIGEYYAEACRGNEVRKNLIALRGALADEREKRKFAYQLAGDFTALESFLSHEDPKVRRNAALILGAMESEDVLPSLFEAYQKEETRFIRADYLQAMDMLDCSGYLPKLQERLEFLLAHDGKEEEQKHRMEEIRMLRQILIRCRGIERHRFTGGGYRGPMILTANRCQREATAEQISGGKITMLQGGIRVSGVEAARLLPVRTYTELLFPVPGLESVSGDAEEIGRRLAREPLLELVGQLHDGTPPFYYRLELKSSLAPDKKGSFIRKLSEALERASRGAWINSAADYELELRLVQRRDGAFLTMVKLFTIPERRFHYRRESVASSIAPVNAALAVRLARPYLKENGWILDPFCGVGTMLIERNLAVRARALYGTDIFGEAVEKARRNTELARMQIHYMNRDFFTFTHEHPFDEIITDMPQVTAAKQAAQIREIYARFFAYAGSVLKDEAMMILYASEPDFVRQESAKYGIYRILRSWVVNERQRTELFVIEVKQNREQ